MRDKEYYSKLDNITLLDTYSTLIERKGFTLGNNIQKNVSKAHKEIMIMYELLLERLS